MLCTLSVDLLLKAKGAKFVHIRVMSEVPETEATGPPVLLKLGTKSKSEDAKKYIGKSKELETNYFSHLHLFLTGVSPSILDLLLPVPSLLPIYSH